MLGRPGDAERTKSRGHEPSAQVDSELTDGHLIVPCNRHLEERPTSMATLVDFLTTGLLVHTLHLANEGPGAKE